MAKSGRSIFSSQRKALVESGLGVFGVAVMSVLLYFLIGLLHLLPFLHAYSHGIDRVRLWTAIVVMALGLLGTVIQLFEQARAIAASDQVANAIDQMKRTGPGRNLSDITASEVAATLKGKVGEKAVNQLFDQHIQQALVDDDYFREELGKLIVTYLQPLPRNAKRLVNRFRVNLLIAHGRGLLTSDPKVTTEQLGKWLVLMERWPQLGRALSASPDKMKGLEKTSGSLPAVPNGAGSANVSSAADPQPSSTTTVPAQAVSGSGVVSAAAAPAPTDPFTELLLVLAPFYVGDEDLRKFIHSDPPIALVVERLAHFGADETKATEMAPAAN